MPRAEVDRHLASQRLSRFVRKTLLFSRSHRMRYCCLKVFIHRYNLERRSIILGWNTTRIFSAFSNLTVVPGRSRKRNGRKAPVPLLERPVIGVELPRPGVVEDAQGVVAVVGPVHRQGLRGVLVAIDGVDKSAAEAPP